MGLELAHRRQQACCGIAHTEVVEDYLKSVFDLCTRTGGATTSTVAAQLGLAPPTVSAMLKRLEATGLIRRSGNHQVNLTEHGLRHARSVVRRHRLLETFLAEVLDVSWDEVHAEAEVLEHAISTRLEERIDALLKHPTHDPHGDPIPPATGVHVETWANSLTKAATGTSFVVERVSDRDSTALRHLSALGIGLGSVLKVLEWAPFGGPLWVEVEGKRYPLGAELVKVLHGRST